MFAFCCEQPKDVQKPELSQADHLNPIYRRLNNKHSHQHSQLHSKQPISQPNSMIPAQHKVAQKQKINLNTSVLAKSILISEQQSINKAKSVNTWHSRQRDLEVNQFNQIKNPDFEDKEFKLRQRYISALQKNNQLLQMELSKTRNKQLKTSKLTGQLLELRQRLNKIDLSRICKISGVTSSTSRFGKSQVQSTVKQNKI